MKKKFNQITDEEKRGYVDLYLTGEYTLREVAKMGGISHTTLYKWIVNGIPCKRKSRYIIVNEKAELRAHALDTMIDVAEANLNIKIRKKAGAKQ